MIDMLKRHEIQVLRRAEHTWSEIAALSGVSEKTARRIAHEDRVSSVDNAAERARRQVGRPSTAEAYRDVMVQALTEDPSLRSVELLHHARQAGYTGGKSAVYALAQTLQTRTVTPLVRRSQHAGTALVLHRECARSAGVCVANSADLRPIRRQAVRKPLARPVTFFEIPMIEGIPVPRRQTSRGG